MNPTKEQINAVIAAIKTEGMPEPELLRDFTNEEKIEFFLAILDLALDHPAIR